MGTWHVDVVLVAMLWNRGLTIGLLCLLVAATHVLAFGLGYWYFVRRNHQADLPTRDHEGERERTRG